MVAYSFKSSFISDISAKVKRQTIRMPRRRHARAGEALQFFTGPRMKPVRIGSALCCQTRDVRLDFVERKVVLDDFETIEGCEAWTLLRSATASVSLPGLLIEKTCRHGATWPDGGR